MGYASRFLEWRKYREPVEDDRCPATKGLPEDAVHLLHQSFVHILRMRRSIERTDRLIASSRQAALASRELLDRP
jgi:hypothetical protein